MKTMIKKAGYFLAMFALAACEPFDFEQEMGQKVICIISDNDLVYTTSTNPKAPDIFLSTVAARSKSTGMWTLHWNMLRKYCRVIIKSNTILTSQNTLKSFLQSITPSLRWE